MKNTENFVGAIIKTENIGECDLRVRVLCAQGVRVFTAVGVRKANAKLKSAIQLFTVAEFSVAGHKIVGAHIMQSNHNIAKDIARYYLACAICEVVPQALSGAGVGDFTNVFVLTLHAFDRLNCTECGLTREIFTEYFTALLVELGYDIGAHQDINSAYIEHLDIKIPNTKFYLV